MKALVCDLCGSNDIMKQDGCFVCQHCGTKYSVEEARKMLIEGSVEVQGTVKIDNSASVKNYLEIGSNALIAGNGKQAEIYANKALEVDPRNSDAWVLKMKSYESTATIGDVQTDDLCAAAINAIEYASDREKAERETYGYILNRASTLILVAKSKLEDTDDIRRTMARFSSISFVTAASNTQEADQKTISLYDGVANAAINLTSFVPDDALKKHQELPFKLLECAVAYRAETDSVQQRLRIYSSELLDSAVGARNRQFEKMRERAIAALSKDSIESIESEIQSLEKEFKSGGNAQEYDNLSEKIKNLMEQRARLGVFKKKEEKALSEEINCLIRKRNSIETGVRQMRASIRQRIQIKKEIYDLLKK